MFYTDAQTMEDLSIFSKRKKTVSVFSFYDRTITSGGNSELERMFRHPLSDKNDILRRAGAIEYFSCNDPGLYLDKGMFDFIEYYLSQVRVPLRKTGLNVMTTAVRAIGKLTQEQYAVKRGITFLGEVIRNLYQFAIGHNECDIVLIREYSAEVLNIVEGSKELTKIANSPLTRLSAADITGYDYLFRYESRDNIRKLLRMVYEVDVLTSLGSFLKEEGFCVCEMSDGKGIRMEGVRHPLIENAVSSDIEYGDHHNMCFITGANMSGKSTFMKAFSISVYLAHLGFPVPANSMKCPVFKGLFTTINLGDDISLGYSHFYAEVERIKKIAMAMREHPELMIVFDELFRGTNLKDAYDASVAIMTAFTRCRCSSFLISTHITEVADELREIPQVIYRYFPTDYEGDEFKYTYKLGEGISGDRLGMKIISRAGIISMLEECAN